MQKLIVIACAFVALVAYATMANSQSPEEAVKERKDLMKNTVARAAKLSGQMIKGTVPFDSAKAADAMRKIASVPDKYVTLFPEGTAFEEIEDSHALPAVWESFDDFKELAAKLEDKALVAASAAEKGASEFGAAFKDMTGVCKQCHESYRADLDE